MKIDGVHGPNVPEGPANPVADAPAGAVGRWTGRVAAPAGHSFLPSGTGSRPSPDSLLQGRAPLHTALMERCTMDGVSARDLKPLHDWLAQSDGHVESYVDAVMMNAMFKDLAGGKQPGEAPVIPPGRPSI